MWTEIALFILAVLAYFYYEVTKQFDFFKNLGVPYSKPTFPFGSKAVGLAMMRKISFADMDAHMVENEFPNEKIFGYFLFGQPIFLVNDMELIKRVMVKDYEYFMDRRAFDSPNKIMNAFLTNLRGTEWKRMRSLMSGVFTSGKLKLMTKHIVKVGDNLEEFISEQADQVEEFDMKVVGGKMTMDSILTAGFGLEANSFKDPDNICRIMALTLVSAPGYTSKWDLPKIFLIFAFPKLCKFLNIIFMDKKAISFFDNVIKKTYHSRLETGERRNDIIDLIVDEAKSFSSKNKKEEIFESEFEADAAIDTTDIKELDTLDLETLLVANAMLFFFAGFETTSLGLSIICNRLANYQDIQDRVISEMEEVLGVDDEVTFEKVQELKYMDMVISESFRLNNIISVLERMCTKDYKVPGSNYIIPKGRFVKTYARGIARSGANFMNADQFDPENFDTKNNPNKFGLMIFGQGPRNCIGMRLVFI